MTTSLASSIQGSIQVFGGTAYAGARRKIAALVKAMDATEASVVRASSGFSEFYRSLPEGTTISVDVEQELDRFCLSLSVLLQSDIASQISARIPYFSVHLEPQEDAKNTRLRLERMFNVADHPDIETIHHILDWRSGQELRSDMNKALQQLNQSQDLINAYQQDLSVAAVIQGEMLSAQSSPSQNVTLDAFGFVSPCREIGGDFYDVIPFGNRDTLLVIGDVSGKGLPSALMMSTCLTLIRAYSEFINSPSIIASKVNDRLVAQNETCMFTTLLIVYLDSSENELVYCNAGHNPGFLIAQSGSIDMLVEVHGPAVGVAEGATYTETRLPFHPGDRLLLYTDGVSEAFNERRELFGFERLRDFLRAPKPQRLTSREFLEGLFIQVMAFIGVEPVHDDITLLSAYSIPRDQSFDDSSSQSLHRDLSDDMEGLQAAKLSTKEFCESHAIPREIESKLHIVLDELLANVIHYGTLDEGVVPEIELFLTVKDGSLNVQLMDNKKAFNPFSIPEPDVDLDLDDRMIGGLGIFLVRQLTDLFHYERVNGRNVVVLEVAVPSESSPPQRLNSQQS